jgi:hypothetical protein
MLRKLRRRLLQEEQRPPIAMGKPYGDRDHRSRPQDTDVPGGETPANRGQVERNVGKAGIAGSLDADAAGRMHHGRADHCRDNSQNTR